MKKSYLFLSLLLFTGCLKGEFENAQSNVKEQTREKAETVFGIKFAPNHDWCTTVKGEVTITLNPSDFNDITKVQILTCSPFGNGDANGSTILNEVDASFGDVITLTYDRPSNVDRLYATCVSNKGDLYIRGFNPEETNIEFGEAEVVTRGLSNDVKSQVDALPTPTLGSSTTSYARDRGYNGFDNDLLYSVNGSQMFSLADYQSTVKQDLRDIIFTYLPNKVSNIEKIETHAFYNSTSYPITTGEDPIIIEAIYKNDGGYHEVEHCALYYYYFDGNATNGMTEAEEIQFFKDLPKYRLLDMNDVVVGLGLQDDEIRKAACYALIYWGDSMTPTEGTVGSYTFPQGYKIGFMLRNEGKDVHKGELYCDGRLNGEVNKWGHLASAKLGENDSRMAWLNGNNRYFLCCESGTDRDFNDIVFEIAGGIEPIGEIPDIDYNVYTFCYEDTPDGDYDMNDIVIKAKRIKDTQVEYSIVACGAYDEIYVYGINGKKIKNSLEVHSMFKTEPNNYVNTVPSQDYFTPITEVINVNKNFSFLNESTQPYIVDATINNTVKLAKAGEDPHAIMIPYNLKYPIERVCIKDAYSKFNEWGENEIISTDWYKYPVSGKVY